MMRACGESPPTRGERAPALPMRSPRLSRRPCLRTSIPTMPSLVGARASVGAGGRWLTGMPAELLDCYSRSRPTCGDAGPRFLKAREN